MARIKYTVTFPAARPGDEVTWPNTVHVYPDANTPVPLQSGQSLNESLAFSGWSDATSVVFTRPAGDNDTVTVTTGSPSGTGAAVPAPSGGSTPIPANDTGATTDTLTPDPISGTGSATVVVVPADCTVLAIKIEGDDFPRIIVAADPTDDAALLLGDGTFDPASGAAGLTYTPSRPTSLGITQDLFVNGLSASGHLGVGNSDAATTPGTVVRRFEVFDAAGASLGFVAVYDAIA